MYPHRYATKYGSYGQLELGAVTAGDLDRVAGWRVTKKAQFSRYAAHTIRTALGEVGKPVSAIADGSVDINFFPGRKTGNDWLATIPAGTGPGAKRLAPGFGALKRWAQSLGAPRTARAITSSAAWFYYNVERPGSGASAPAPSATPESLAPYTPAPATTGGRRRSTPAGDAAAEEARQRSGSGGRRRRRRGRGRGRSSGSGQQRSRGGAAQKGFFAKYWWMFALGGVAVVGLTLLALPPKSKRKRAAAPRRKALPMAANGRGGARRKARRGKRRGGTPGTAAPTTGRAPSGGGGTGAGAAAAVSASHGAGAGR